MFTGIVTDIGEITALEQRGDLWARIATGYAIEGIAVGASIACDGCCLTVVAKGTDPRGWFDVEISAETLAKTNMQSPAVGWRIGRRLNLERALKIGDELGGHIVSGHVDGVAEILSMRDEGASADDLAAKFPRDEVATYFLTLLLQDSAVWGGVTGWLEGQK